MPAGRGIMSEITIRQAQVRNNGLEYGGFWTNSALVYSRIFKVASSGESARRDPVAYWTQGSQFEHVIDSIVGGPPVAANYEKWRQFAPSLQAPSKRVPVLIEYQAGDPAALEVFESWTKQGVPAELVLYPGEGHLFHQPKHQFFSMQRNVDWFSFWLLGQKDGDPAKTQQYQRWELLKQKISRITPRSKISP